MEAGIIRLRNAFTDFLFFRLSDSWLLFSFIPYPLNQLSNGKISSTGTAIMIVR